MTSQQTQDVQQTSVFGQFGQSDKDVPRTLLGRLSVDSQGRCEKTSYGRCGEVRSGWSNKTSRGRCPDVSYVQPFDSYDHTYIDCKMMVKSKFGGKHYDIQ